MRVRQPEGTRGSLRWMQALVGQRRLLFERELRATLDLALGVTIDWRSPLSDDDRAEYRDAAFLERVGLEAHRDALAQFWPRGGPQWDALATTSDGKVLLFEGKAHVGELRSSCMASPESRRHIERALAAAKAFFAAPPEVDWTSGCYQYANRLAHLFFLRERGVDAHLVFVYVTGDREADGPASPAEWQAAIAEVHRALGLPADQPLDAVHDVFLDVRQIGSPEAVV